VERADELATILAAVQDTFRAVLGLDALELTLHTTADDVEAWDSLTNIQLMIGIEQRFGVRFSAHEIQRYRNVGDLCAAVREKVAARP